MPPRPWLAWLACAALVLLPARPAHVRVHDADRAIEARALAANDLVLNGLVFGRHSAAHSGLPAALFDASDAGGSRLWLIQFGGPIRNAWHTAMRAAGLTVVTHIAPYAYVVWGDASAFAAAVAHSRVELPIVASGEYLPVYRLSPSLRNRLAQPPASLPGTLVDVVVQRFRGADSAAANAQLDALLHDAGAVSLGVSIATGKFSSAAYRVPMAMLADIARGASVFSVREWRAPTLHDERQGQILAGAVITSGGRTTLVGPGYLAFLGSRGLSTDPNAYPIVAVTDDGLDSGDPSAIAHPDFYVNGDPEQPSRVSFALNCTLDAAANDIGGHGTLNAGIVAGYNARALPPFQDSAGYALGMGIAPNARLGTVKLFADSGAFDLSQCGQALDAFVREAYARGARISSNSWGLEADGAYDEFAQAFDALTRDADGDPGNGLQEYLHVFSAGNAGPGETTIGSPGTAKNVITVGATENVRDDGVLDGCGVADAGDADAIASFSSRGPTADGRVKPDVVAPGTHIQGPATQQAGFNAASVCGGSAGAAHHPPGQTLYTWSSGTSHAAPAIAGAVSLASAYYASRIAPGASPSPAMLKALLTGAPRTMPSAPEMDPAFGWGMPDLSRLFDGVARRVIDQSHVLTESGQTFEFRGRVGMANGPFRVTLAWTDAPGPTVGPSYVNDLDLEVQIGDALYRGNVFGPAGSEPGGQPDPRNNVESIALPAGTQGDVVIRVVARNIAGDGVPGNDNPLDQDFALVVYNPEAGSVSGTLRDAQTGAGIPAARIEAVSESTGAFSTASDASGAWALSVPPGRYAISAHAYGFLTADALAVGVTAGSAQTLSLSLSPAASAVVSGFVTDAQTGLPVVGQVRVRGAAADPPVTTTDTDDATGFYRFALAMGQAYTLTFTSPLHRQAQWRIATLAADTTVSPVLTATTTAGGLVGTLLDATDGSAVAGARLSIGADGLAVTSTIGGHYQVVGLAPAEYTVVASRAPWASITATAAVSQSRLSRLNLTLPSARAQWSAARVTRTLEYGARAADVLQLSNDGTHTLTFSLAGTPLPPAWLTTSPTAGAVPPGAAISLTLDWNAATVAQPGIHDGTLALALNDPRRQRAELHARLQADPARDMGRVRGQMTSLGVCDAAERPAPEAVLTAQTAGGAVAAITPTIAGAFSYYLPAGTYTLTGSAQGHVTRSATAQVMAGMITRADFGLRLDAACIRVAPESISRTVPLSEVANVSVTVENRGTRAMRVESFTSAESPAAARVDRGGPDAYGYTWRTSADAAGPAVDWVDPGAGRKLVLSDDATTEVALPFEFPFYDVSVTRIGVSNNGAILVRESGGFLDWVNQPLSSTIAPAYLIAPFWDDLDGQYGGVYVTAFTRTSPARVAISWVNRPHFDLEGLASLQAVLYEDGAILFQYADTDFGVPAWDAGASATVGIKGPDADRALEFSFMSPSVPDHFAICFRRPLASDCGAPPTAWLTGTGVITIAPASSATVTVGLDAAALAQPGMAAARLNLFNSSPIPVVGIPVNLFAPVPAHFGRVTGAVWSARGCGDDLAPLPSAQLRSGVWPHGLAPDPDGTFSLWLPGGSQALTARAAGREVVTRSLDVVSGVVTSTDFVVRQLEPCGRIEPGGGLTVTLTPGHITTREVSIANSGPAPMSWRLGMSDGALAPEDAVDLVRDGGFEHTPLTFDSGAWGADSFRFGTPLCTTLPPFYCGVGSGSAGPRTGNWFAWLFGSSRGDFGSISQTMHISFGAASLVFHAWVGVVGGPDDTVRVTMDGEHVADVPVTTTTQGYLTHTVDVSRFANDREHTLSFVYSVAPRTRVSIDDVSLTLAEPRACEAEPAWLGVEPAGGQLGAGQIAGVTLALSAERLEPGDYQAVLCVLTNDPRRSRHFAPVTLRIVPAHLVYLPALARPKVVPAAWRASASGC